MSNHASEDSIQPTLSDSAVEMRENTGQIWFQEDERWELTWPIWHMLPRHERKALALKHGCKTIGEFEEYMTLQRGITDSTAASSFSIAIAYDNTLAYPQTATTTASSQSAKKQSTRIAVEDEDNDEDASNSDEKLDELWESEQRVTTEQLSSAELIRYGGKILVLPEEMLHRVFQFLPVDSYATLALVSPHWKSFTRTEAVYKRLCERLYLNQSKRRTLHVGRFGNSYRTMLERRPRVRAGGGVYVMKYTKVKPIQRDMWTEVPVGAVLEMVYYRYIYFQENGSVLYALTASPPHEMFRRFLKVSLNPKSFEDPSIVLGSYQVQKTQVTVQAKQEWQHVCLELTIRPEYSFHGRWGYLSFDRHMTSTTNNFEAWSPDRITYDVPEEPFRFVRDKRL
ncbi:hypothetical protein ACA910_022478 [Epithemia clementina (nom. ined.)]